MDRGPATAAPGHGAAPRRSTTHAALVWCLAVLATSSLLAGCRRDPAPPAAGPTVPPGATLPPTADADRDAVSAYLAGDGRPLLEVRRLTDEVAATPPSGRGASCRRLVSRDLPAVVPDVTAAAALSRRIPEPLTARLAVNDVAARLAMLASCLAGRPHLDDRLAEVAAAAGPLDQRLAQLGVSP